MSNPPVLPRSFWTIGGLALIWSVLSALNLLFQLNPDTVAKLSATERALIENRPGWVTAGSALAVFAGAIGSAMLSGRRTEATTLYLASAFGSLIALFPIIAILGSEH